MAVQFDKLFGNKLKKTRMKIGFSQAEVGRKLGLSRTTISNFEAGRTTLRLDQWAKLSKVLSLPLDTPQLFWRYCKKKNGVPKGI